MKMKKINTSPISAGIAEIVEKKVRLGIFKVREATLRKELRVVQSEINKLVGRRTRGRVNVKRIAEPKKRGKSVRELIIALLKRSKRPMTVDEITKRILKKGYKSKRKEPEKTVDTVLRKYKESFKKTAPGTFQYIG